MSFFSYLVTIHVAGLILWLGGAWAAALLLRAELSEAAPQPGLALAREKVFKGVAGPGLMVALIAGIALILDRPYLMKQGWLHAKLTLAFLAVGLHMMIRVASKKLDRGEARPAAGKILGFQLGLGLCALGALVLVFTQAF